MKSITILSLSLFQIAITASLSRLFSPSPSPPIPLLLYTFPHILHLYYSTSSLTSFYLHTLFTPSSPISFLSLKTPLFIFLQVFVLLFSSTSLTCGPSLPLSYSQIHWFALVLSVLPANTLLFSSPPSIVPIQAGVITGAIIGVVLGLLVLIVVIYYLMRFLVARRVFSLSVRSVPSLWPAALCQSGLCQGLELRPEPIPGTDTCVAKLA